MKVNNNCVGCGQCAAFCKFGAIVVRGKAIMTSSCVECRLCIAYCPVKAIEA
ncbi:4Fe-4S binding protein [Methanolobus psychrotolerans]|uniref:4Fe-4S binding protein n=1 Tax=Methanolobus psychrotolerans TaxID=1874706 RepID=UPI000B91A01D|nr:4Fe-4S binding protein [Methanolobus psychrotolerans]